MDAVQIEINPALKRRMLSFVKGFGPLRAKGSDIAKEVLQDWERAKKQSPDARLCDYVKAIDQDLPASAKLYRKHPSYKAIQYLLGLARAGQQRKTENNRWSLRKIMAEVMRIHHIQADLLGQIMKRGHWTDRQIGTFIEYARKEAEGKPRRVPKAA